MKNWNKWALATAMTVLFASPYSLNVLAQEVEMGIDILLQTGQQAPKKQEQATYVIVNELGQVVWEHLSSDDLQAPLLLQPGKYVLRLYDAQAFKREGLAVSARKLEIIMNHRDKPKKVALNGKISQDEQGQYYYEVPFQMDSSNQQEDSHLKFVFYFATEDVPQEVIEETTQEASMTPSEPKGQVKFTLKDVQQQPLVNEVITIQDKTYYTNEQGEVIVDLPIGEYPYSIGGLEGEHGENTFIIAVGEQTVVDFVVDATLTTGDVKVTVVDEVGTPIANQEIRIADYMVQTNEQGQASVSELVPGHYSVQLSVSEDYEQPESVDIEVAAGKVVSFTVTLVPHQERSQTVTLAVMDEAQQPIVNAQLQLDQRTYVSDATGRIQIANLLPGEYRYQLHVPKGYEAIHEGHFMVDEQETVIAPIIVKKETLQNDSVTFHVIADDGTAVEGAVIEFAGQTVTTNANGQGVLQSIATGTYNYRLVSLPKGYKGNIQGQYVVANLSESITLSVEKEKEQPQVRPLEVVVEDQDHQRIANVTVTIANQTIVTNQDGVARLEQIPVGRHSYQISNVPNGYTGTLKDEFEMPADTDHRLTITLEKPRRLAKVTVKVVDASGIGVTNATVQLGGLTVITDGNGVANFGEVKAGNYQLTVPKVPQDYQEPALNKRLAIGEGAVMEEIVTLQAIPTVGKVTIKVIDPKGQGVTNAVVKLNQQTYQTDASGVVVVERLAPGTYSYQLMSAPSEYDQTTPVLKFDLAAGQEVNRSIQLNGKGTATVAASSSSSVQSEPTSISETKVRAKKTVGLPLTGEQIAIGMVPIAIAAIVGGLLLMKRKKEGLRANSEEKILEDSEGSKDTEH